MQVPTIEAPGTTDPPVPSARSRKVMDMSVLPRIVIVVAAALQLVVLVPFTVASGLVAPLWAIVALYVLWLVAAVILVLVARRQPFATPVVPLVNAVLLWAAITAGEGWLGWTA